MCWSQCFLKTIAGFSCLASLLKPLYHLTKNIKVVLILVISEKSSNVHTGGIGSIYTMVAAFGRNINTLSLDVFDSRELKLFHPSHRGGNYKPSSHTSQHVLVPGIARYGLRGHVLTGVYIDHVSPSLFEYFNSTCINVPQSAS